MSSQEGNDGKTPPFTMADLAAALPAGSGALSAADRAGLVNALKGKLQHLAGQSAYLESLSSEVKRRVNALQELQHQHNEVEENFRQERAALEAKYQKLYQPFYTKRFEIVSGSVDVEDNKTGTVETTEVEKEKGVPEFWLTAMKTNEVLTVQITERDEGALKYLKDIKSYTLEKPKGFRLDFIFDQNPYFTNTVLSKTYHMVDDDEPILERAIGTEIEWCPGKNLTQKVLKKKSKKGDKNTKPVTKTTQCDSFFNFFSPPQVPDEDDDDIDQDEAEQLQDAMEQDYDIGSTLKDKIIPHAVSWFTGEALQGEEFDDDDEDDDGDEEEEEDDDNEEDDEEDEDDDDEDEDAEELRSNKKNTSSTKSQTKNNAAQQSGEQPPECKQQ